MQNDKVRSCLEEPLSQKRSEQRMQALSRVDFVIEQLFQITAMGLSRFSAAPSDRLSHLPFESDGAFPAQY